MRGLLRKSPSNNKFEQTAVARLVFAANSASLDKSVILPERVVADNVR
jgi:hypothetical protein